MARITDFCCKTAYQNLSKFFCFRSIVRCFQRFVRGSSPFGKVVSHEPPLLLGNYCLWPPPPSLRISTDLLWQGYGYFLETHIPVKTLTKDSIKKRRPYQRTCTIISISNWPPTGQEQGVHVHAYCVIFLSYWMWDEKNTEKKMSIQYEIKQSSHFATRPHSSFLTPTKWID